MKKGDLSSPFSRIVFMDFKAVLARILIMGFNNTMAHTIGKYNIILADCQIGIE